jgi:hypothetical protein
MNNIALDVIYDYIAHMPVPRKRYGRFADNMFGQEAYGLWAAYEILRRVAKNPNRRPVEVIDEYRMEMEDLSLINSKTSWIFSVATDVAEDILREFI